MPELVNQYIQRKNSQMSESEQPQTPPTGHNNGDAATDSEEQPTSPVMKFLSTIAKGTNHFCGSASDALQEEGIAKCLSPTQAEI